MFCFNEYNVMLTWNIIDKGFQQGSPISPALFAERPKGFLHELGSNLIMDLMKQLACITKKHFFPLCGHIYEHNLKKLSANC